MSKFITLIKKFCQSHHAAIASLTAVVGMFLEDALKVYQKTNHISATDLRGIAIALFFASMPSIRAAFASPTVSGSAADTSTSSGPSVTTGS